VVFYRYSGFLCHDITEILLKVALNTTTTAPHYFDVKEVVIVRLNNINSSKITSKMQYFKRKLMLGRSMYGTEFES
jgi:hypothetical protein